MPRRLALLFFLTLIVALTSMGQESEQVIRRRVVSYNVENLFDTIDDPETDDRDFLPGGAYHWTKGRYQSKVQSISRTLSRIGEWDYPALIGLVEIENVQVTRDLTDAKPLRRITCPDCCPMAVSVAMRVMKRSARRRDMASPAYLPASGARLRMSRM